MFILYLCYFIYLPFSLSLLYKSLHHSTTLITHTTPLTHTHHQWSKGRSLLHIYIWFLFMHLSCLPQPWFKIVRIHQRRGNVMDRYNQKISRMISLRRKLNTQKVRYLIPSFILRLPCLWSGNDASISRYITFFFSFFFFLIKLWSTWITYGHDETDHLRDIYFHGFGWFSGNNQSIIFSKVEKLFFFWVFSELFMKIINYSMNKEQKLYTSGYARKTTFRSWVNR